MEGVQEDDEAGDAMSSSEDAFAGSPLLSSPKGGCRCIEACKCKLCIDDLRL